jgi:hypothetical protein
MMVESAQDRTRSDGADALNWTPERRVFVQRAVGSDLVVVAAITAKDSAQVRLPYDNDVVKPKYRAQNAPGARYFVVVSEREFFGVRLNYRS